MVVILSTIAVFGIIVLIWMFILHRNVARLHAAVLRSPFVKQGDGRPPLPDGDEPRTASTAPVPRQIVHDLNNLLSTMGGFADAALEDLSSDDPIRKDLKEISGAADRAKGVVKQLYSFTPPKGDKSAVPRSVEMTKSVTETYALPKERPHPFKKISSYPPIAKPVPEYRKPSYPPMAKTVTSEHHLHSQPSPRPDSADLVTGRTSSFPAPPRTKTTGEIRGDRTAAGADIKPRLLIVDDETQLLTMFKRVFEPQGYSVTTFSDSLDALANFKENPTAYDLAILDQRMPEMSGSNLATQMIGMRSDFPIILLTGYSDTVSPDDAKRIGIRRYLSKPIPQAKLSAVIRGILEPSTSI